MLTIKGSERFCYKMRFTDDDPWEVNSDVDDRAVFIDNFRGKGSGKFFGCNQQFRCIR